METQIKNQEKAIDEIINRYGETIDLKKSPYLIVEIIQQFQGLLNTGGNVAECLPPGGPPKRGDEVIRYNKVLKEISSLSKAIKELDAKVTRIIK